MNTKIDLPDTPGAPALALAPCSACPECGCTDWSHIETHPGLIECDKCGHPREATTGDLRRSLISMGYDPDSLARKIVDYLKGINKTAYYMITGYNSEGIPCVGMPVESLVGDEPMLKERAMELLHKGGHTRCVRAEVTRMKTSPNT